MFASALPGISGRYGVACAGVITTALPGDARVAEMRTFD